MDLCSCNMMLIDVTTKWRKQHGDRLTVSEARSWILENRTRYILREYSLASKLT